ncbi:restriction endonuclease subunit S [Aeromonas caviae]|uniref:restriction endonuclease subunit S n=1 Tax=Aeromonas caviae TaxID=648 RepID=UPI0029D5D353|nr:restriction endonuclease subunit S [Aeromonas caviae]MDX7856372.1 restriction endonuclease subunit S [Aeromonas caviae]
MKHPADWSYKRLEDVVSRKKYAMVDGPFGSNLKSEHYKSEGVPVLQSGFVTSGKFSADKYVYVDHQLFNEQKRSAAKGGDILMAKIGAQAGRCAIIPQSHPEAIIAGNCLKLSFDDNDTEFFSFVLCFNYEMDGLSEIKTETAQPAISLKSLKAYRVPVPPLLEQKKIAKILSTWDKAISTTEQLLANSQQQKKALMQQLLTGKKRLLDQNGVRFSGEWKASKLSKLFERVTTKNNGQSANVVTISGQHGFIRQEEFFKKTVASETLDGYFLLKQGQFAYNKSYSNGYPMGAIKRLNRYPDGVVTTLYICFELSNSDGDYGDFWEHYFESGILNKGLSQIAHEGGRAHGLLNVKPSDFFSLKVPVPSFEEQQKIAAVLSTADQEITALQQKLAALKQEKKALMQQLLTGKRRVKVEGAA